MSWNAGSDPQLAEELEEIRTVEVAESLRDLCLFGTPIPAVPPEPASPGFTYGGDPVPCGISVTSPTQVRDGSRVTLAEILVRLPWPVEVPAGGRLRVTHRQGQALVEAEDYALLGAPSRGQTVQTARATRVIGGSVL
jgi:hypothetical protein